MIIPIFIPKKDDNDDNLTDILLLFDGKYGLFRCICIILMLVGLVIFMIVTMFFNYFCLGIFFTWLGILLVMSLISISIE